MKTISLGFLPIFFILLSEALAQEYIDYRIVPEANRTYGSRIRRAANPKCTVPGVICQDCKNIHWCDAELTSSPLWTCLKNETCDKGQCTATPSPRCSSSSTTFICNSEGVFPDPVDCFKYHYCIRASTGIQRTKFIDYPRFCTNDTTHYYSFNPKVAYCSNKLTAEVCPTAGYPVPVCEYPGQTGALTENTSIYYICKKYLSTTPNSKIYLYPYQYICENGKVYERETYKCELPGVSVETYDNIENNM